MTSYCTHCGNAYDAADHFCRSCGKPIGDSRDAAAPIHREQQESNVPLACGLTGSILGIVGSLLWLPMGTGFWAGFMIGFFESDSSVYIFNENPFYGLGFLISLLQFFLTVPLFVLGIIFSSISKRKSQLCGVWLLCCGIVGTVFNVFNLIPNVLVIIAGSFALKRRKSNNNVFAVQHTSPY